MPCYPSRVDERERQIQAIAEAGRAVRAKSSRALWIAGLAIGAVCVAAFVAIMLVDGSSSASAPIRLGDRSRGFATGVAIGVVAGIAIGYAIARRKR